MVSCALDTVRSGRTSVRHIHYPYLSIEMVLSGELTYFRGRRKYGSGRRRSGFPDRSGGRRLPGRTSGMDGTSGADASSGGEAGPEYRFHRHDGPHGTCHGQLDELDGSEQRETAGSRYPSAFRSRKDSLCRRMPSPVRRKRGV